MRICLVSFEYPPDSLIVGGAGTYASLLAKGLARRGVDIVTITTGPMASYGRKVYRIPINNMTYWRRIFFSESAMDVMASLNQKHKFDLVHLNEPHIVTRNLGLPVVCTFHSTQFHEMELNIKGGSLRTVKGIRDIVVKNPVGHLCDIITGYMSSKIICPCSDMIRLLKYCFVDKSKVHIIPNGIDCKEFDRARSDTEFMVKHDLKKDTYLLYVGRLSSLKGVHYLIEAFKTVKKRHVKLKLVIAGKGDFEPYLRKVASNAPDILFLGHVESLEVKKALYENCLAVVVPSIYETFPMVVLEAMACSKPVVASNVGGIPSMVKHGRNGFLVKPMDVGGLEVFISKLCADPNLRKKMGLLGRKSAEKEFTADKMVNETLKVYESLL
jgi:glycosyltransferase involved in cell wall biosynthesis